MKFSSLTIPLGHSWEVGGELENRPRTETNPPPLPFHIPKARRPILEVLDRPLPSASLALLCTHILEAPVQDLQFLARELGLLLQLLQTLWPVTHRGQFKLILHAVCGGGGGQCGGRGTAAPQARPPRTLFKTTDPPILPTSNTRDQPASSLDPGLRISKQGEDAGQLPGLSVGRAHGQAWSQSQGSDSPGPFSPG